MTKICVLIALMSILGIAFTMPVVENDENAAILSFKEKVIEEIRKVPPEVMEKIRTDLEKQLSQNGRLGHQMKPDIWSDMRDRAVEEVVTGIVVGDCYILRAKL
ncbi:unnamed protein product, partial [Mesorhabditis belari]|uniref:Uncharacterized protein n=1 Tax=Mesorhabditis belari TaxID=2138241 RepID=A0AAF3FJ02_9BILA